jgi:hypothetical protein
MSSEFLFSGIAGVLTQRVVPCSKAASTTLNVRFQAKKRKPIGTCDKGFLREEPDAVKVARPVLKQRRGE